MLTSVREHGTSLPAIHWQRERLFFAGMALAAAATTFVGFAPTYYLKAAYGTRALPPLVHLHGILFTSWIVLLAIQISLVAGRRTDLHRRLGIAGGVLAALMTVVAPIVAIGAARRGVMGVRFLVVPMTSVIVFPMLVGAALITRRDPQTHKRLMLFATAELLTAAVGRLPVVRNRGALGDFGVIDMFVAAIVIYDVVTRRRLHPATIWGGVFFIAAQPLRMAIGRTDWWVSFGRWLTS